MGVLGCTRIEFILAPEESPDLHFGVSRGRTPWAGPPIEIKRPSNLSHYPLDPTGHICYYFNMRGFVPSTFCDVE